MLSDDMMFEPAHRLQGLIRRREMSPVELTELALSRIELLNPELNAFTTVIPERALAEARGREEAVAKGGSLGPLHGIPLSIKDAEDVDGVRITYGSLTSKDGISSGDALCTERLRAAGAVIVGKTNMPEYGHSGTTENRLGEPCRNPWDTARTSGGSSGGAAASVVAGVTPVAQGSDGGGSIRIPAGFCGAYGLKATQGRVPRRMADHNSWHPWNSSSVGPITRTVRDAAVMLGVLAGPGPDNEALTIQKPPPDFVAALDRGVDGLRIAWSPDLGDAPVDSEVAEAAHRAAMTFEELGAQVETPDFRPDDYEAVFDTFFTYFCVRGFVTHGDLLEDQAGLLTDYYREHLELGQRTTAKQYFDALTNANRYRAYVDDFFTRYDLLLTPTLAVPAFEIGKEPDTIGGRGVVHRMLGYTPFTYLFNMTGNPAATAPCGFSGDGLPIGLHIVGAREDEETVLAASAAFEQARPWAGKRPRVS